MNLRSFFYASICFLLLAASHVFGGQETRFGNEPGLWDEGRSSVICARVVKVADIPDAANSGSHHLVTLQPLVTIAGHFDTSANRLIIVFLVAETVTSSIKDVPVVGTLLLTVVEPGYVDGDPKQPTMVTPSDICVFMPDSAGAIAIEDMKDKRIYETLARIQTVRAAKK